MNHSQFTNQYSLSKTLRFELKPVGETAEYTEDFKSQYLKEIVKKDEQRSKDYEVIKEIIDDYHRVYIEEKLSEPIDRKTGEVLLSGEDFENAFSYYDRLRSDPRNETYLEDWKTIQTQLRKSLVKAFNDNKRLFSKELITKDLPEWLKADGRWEENKSAVENFKRFTTYFVGFHENRRNIYSGEDHHTAIAYRLMHENLPKYFNNCILYNKITEQYPKLALSASSHTLNSMGVNSIDYVFTPGYFIHLLTQTGIDNFRELIGGKTADERGKEQGLNEQINLFRQQQGLKVKDIPNFTGLYKQILSDRETRSFIPDAFENDKQLLDSLKEYIHVAFGQDSQTERLNQAVLKLHEADSDKIYIKANALTAVSQSIFGSYGVLNASIRHYVETVVYPTPANGKVSQALETKRTTYIRQQKVYSIKQLESMLSSYMNQLEPEDALYALISKFFKTLHPLLTYFAHILQNNGVHLINSISNVTPLLSLDTLNKNRRTPKDENDNGGEGFQQVQKIQKMMDSFIQIIHDVKPLYLVIGRKPIDVPDEDMGFYNDFQEVFDEYSNLTIGLYNKIRNHLTKKPFSTDKIKINFENPTLLHGWDINKEQANTSVMLRKNGLYYLAIIHPGHRKIFENTPEVCQGESTYEKMNYKLLTGANKMLPKVFFSRRGIERFEPPQGILDLYKNGEHKKGVDFSLDSCHKLIDFFKDNISKYKVNPTDEYGWGVFGFRFSPTESYQDISDFYREVEKQGYKLWFKDIATAYIDECIDQGKLFLFQIYNKDFSPYSTGKPNLHTLYWKSLFDPHNLENTTAKLNGEAEIFYRKHSLNKEDRTIHAANMPIRNKNRGNPKKESVFEYDLIKDRRYTVDKFQFHVPITLNFKSDGVRRFNDKINHQLAESTDTHVIGIDRGERHLLYYSVINSGGRIVEQGTLNTINTDQGYKVDYHEKLDKKERERDQARKSWASVENIKELKQGYLSHVIHKITKLIIKYDAIVCLEDLNFGFKRGRFKVEKQVYQKFEKALIDKLNYLVFKDKEQGEPGHCLNAYQLTDQFRSFEKLGKQSGVLFYVQASYTSKIDPVTGFINFLYPKYESLLKSKNFFEKMNAVRYNADKDYFEFTFDYRKMTPSRELGKYQPTWTICTYGDKRYRNFRNTSGIWESKEVNVTEELKSLLANEDIEFASGGDLIKPIAEAKKTKFYKILFRLLQTTLALRHSKTGTEEDFILSPVADTNGVFFDSRKVSEDLPKDADANGAYHIALKGLWNLQQIREWDGESRLNLAMKNVDWLSFAIKKPFLR